MTTDENKLSLNAQQNFIMRECIKSIEHAFFKLPVKAISFKSIIYIKYNSSSEIKP